VIRDAARQANETGRGLPERLFAQLFALIVRK